MLFPFPLFYSLRRMLILTSGCPLVGCYITGCSKQNDGPPHLQDVYIQIPRTCEYVALHGKGELRFQIEFSLMIDQVRFYGTAEFKGSLSRGACPLAL